MLFRYFAKFLRNSIFHVNIVYPIVRVYISIIEPQIKKAYGLYALKTIKNRGVGCRVYGKITVRDADKLVLGDYVRIGSGAFIHAIGGVKIGDNTQISRNLLIYSENHNMDSDSYIPYDEKYIHKSVVIGNSVWIGMNVTITPGVTIGDGAIIGMGTVVSKDVPIGAIVVGAKQRIVNYRDMNKFLSLYREKKYFGKYCPD